QEPRPASQSPDCNRSSVGPRGAGKSGLRTFRLLVPATEIGSSRHMRKEAVRNSLDSLLLHSAHSTIPFRTCSFQREEKRPSNSLFYVYRNDRAALPALDASPSDSSEIPAPHAATATNPRGTRAQPAPYHHPCLPKSRQNPRRALNF